MATFRVGVGSFNIKDGAVGFGTDTDGLGNLKVKGVTKTTGSIVSGASTLTRYSGFAADNINQLEIQSLQLSLSLDQEKKHTVVIHIYLC